ncbi:hypothetical protein AB0P19_02230 [Microbacterium oleivorans]|uniref:hypothetical protein n=1 Tax=Microbacterium oleivorans TaxID=273677 RepID=UPI003418B60F
MTGHEVSDAVDASIDEQPAAWALHRAVTTAALAEIDQRQAHHPTCALCGQRALKLDKLGLCSKVSEPHKKWRAETRAELATGRRR